MIMDCCWSRPPPPCVEGLPFNTACCYSFMFIKNTLNGSNSFMIWQASSWLSLATAPSVDGITVLSNVPRLVLKAVSSWPAASRKLILWILKLFIIFFFLVSLHGAFCELLVNVHWQSRSMTMYASFNYAYSSGENSYWKFPWYLFSCCIITSKFGKAMRAKPWTSLSK